MTDRSAEWAARRRAWQVERLDPALQRAPERRGRFSTISDMPIESLYGPWSLADDDPLREVRAARLAAELGFEGELTITAAVCAESAAPMASRSRRRSGPVETGTKRADAVSQ